MKEASVLLRFIIVLDDPLRSRNMKLQNGGQLGSYEGVIRFLLDYYEKAGKG